MSVFRVFRLPCFPEDEGRTFYIGERDTYEEAVQLREDERGGYYFSSDFIIAEEVGA